MKAALFLLLFIPCFCIAQSYNIETFYKKVELENGVLDEDGNEIDHVFIPTELDPGVYEIEITDGPNDLYEIKGTEVYIKFVTYFGYAGYAQAGILKVKSSSYYSTFYKED